MHDTALLNKEWGEQEPGRSSCLRRQKRAGYESGSLLGRGENEKKCLIEITGSTWLSSHKEQTLSDSH
jgi:hypothetical protein